MYILDPKKIKIERNKKGRITLKRQDRKTFENVSFVRLFPFSSPVEYISVVIKKSGENEDCGIIEKIRSLKPAQRKLVEEGLDFGYFIPEIKEIKKIISKHGLHEWHVGTDKGNKIFYLRSIRENLMLKDNKSVIITDIDKCRYKINNYEKLSQRSILELDRLLL